MKRKTLVTDDGPVKCSNCPATTHQSVDRAREAGWRIGWRPEHPTWCPDCYGARKRPAQPLTQTYDEPLF